MTSPNDLFLTITNYFSWKSHMEDVLRSKGLYQILSRKELELTDDENKSKCDNKSDKGHELITMSIFPDLRSHLKGIDAPDASWTKINVGHVHSFLASCIFHQVWKTRDPKTSAEYLGHPNWDTTMNGDYRSLMENDTWYLVPLPKGRKLVICKWVYRTKYA